MSLSLFAHNKKKWRSDEKPITENESFKWLLTWLTTLFFLFFYYETFQKGLVLRGHNTSFQKG